MSSNLSEIGDAVNSLNLTFNDIDYDNIINTAITSTNDSTGGWIGILIFFIFCSVVFFYILRNKNGFNIQNELSLMLISGSIFLDMGIQLLLFGILGSVYMFIEVYLIFFIIGIFSFLNKEMLSVDT